MISIKKKNNYTVYPTFKNTLFSWCTSFLTIVFLTVVAARKTSCSQLLGTISPSHSPLSQNIAVMEHALDQETGEQRSHQRRS